MDDTDETEDQILFDRIGGIRRKDEENRKMLRELLTPFQSRGLLWIQQIIPELITGESGIAPWVEEGRRMMWTDEEITTHDKKCRLQAQSPQSLPLDEFKLRQRWPAFMQPLYPMPLTLLEAANAVYQVVARRNLSTYSDNLEKKRDKTNIPQYVLAAQTIQDKVVSPIITELNLTITELDLKKNRIQKSQATLGAAIENLNNLGDQSYLLQEQKQLAQTLGELEDRERQAITLQRALTKFREELSRNKDVLDRSRDENNVP